MPLIMRLLRKGLDQQGLETNYRSGYGSKRDALIHETRPHLVVFDLALHESEKLADSWFVQ